MEFVGGREASAQPEASLPGKINYVIGRDPRQWRLGIATFERVKYAGVYQGIDVLYYGNSRQLEFDLLLAPGADVKAVWMRFGGGKRPRITAAGALEIGEVQLKPPVIRQEGRTIDGRYSVRRNGDVGFELAAFDPRKPLVIDPVLVYATRLGGGASSDYGQAIAVDAQGNAYVTGYTYSFDFPVVNAWNAASASSSADVFVSRMNATGTALIYSTYVGGTGYDTGFGMLWMVPEPHG